jgi:hypothetical protein
MCSQLLKKSAAEEESSDRPSCHITSHTAKLKLALLFSREVVLAQQNIGTQTLY